MKITAIVTTLFAAAFLTACSTVAEISSLTINQTNPQTVQIGETLQLTVTVGTIGNPNEAIQWETDNEAIATVNEEGVVTGISGGTTTIHATSIFDETVTDSIVIQVPDVTGFQINQEDPQTLAASETLQLTLTVETEGNANRQATWTSSNPSVATVNTNGLVTTQAGGRAVITATSTQNTSMTDSILIIVQEVTSVTINQTSPVDVTLSETTTLTVTVSTVENATSAVDWTSSDTSIATVENGVVSPVNGGTVQITATSQFDNTQSDTIQINIPQVTQVQISPTNNQVLPVGQTLQLQTTTTSLGGAPQTVTWSTTDATTVSITDTGLATAQQPGHATITATSTFNPSITDTIIIATISPTN